MDMSESAKPIRRWIVDEQLTPALVSLVLPMSTDNTWHQTRAAKNLLLPIVFRDIEIEPRNCPDSVFSVTPSPSDQVAHWHGLDLGHFGILCRAPRLG